MLILKWCDEYQIIMKYTALSIIVLNLLVSPLRGQASVVSKYYYDSSGNRVTATAQPRFSRMAVFFMDQAVVFPGALVNIFGQNFPYSNPGSVSVSVGGLSGKVVRVSPRVITFRIDDGAASGPVVVRLGAGDPIALGDLRVMSEDEDGDCLPYAVELALKLDPNSPDTNKNGIRDGDEDSDGDGLSNCYEVLHGSNPAKKDSDDDRLDDADEINKWKTDPMNPDSDGDGFLDGEEVEFHSNPLDPASTAASLDSSHGELVGSVTTVLSDAPIINDVGGEAMNSVFSLLNASDPSGPPVGETWAAVFSILDESDPSGPTIAETIGLLFSVLNDSQIVGPAVQEAMGDGFSVKNGN